MWSRVDLKTQAKANLKSYYWNGFLVVVLSGLLIGFASFMAGFIGMLLPVVVPVLVSIFVTNILITGIVRYFTISELNRNDAGVGELFGCFQNGYINIVLIMFLRNLFNSLWYLLFIVPGIIKHYEYYMIPYLAAEYPEKDHKEIFKLSKQMMDGNKFDVFILELSFIGWYLLGMLACGFGALFVAPYFQATLAQLYLHLKEERLGIMRGNGGVNPANLSGQTNMLEENMTGKPQISMNGGQGFFVGVQGEFAGANIPLSEGAVLLIGTDANQCNLVINGAQVSPVHLKVEFRGGMFVVTDLSSAGTFNLQGGQLPKNQPVTLASGTYLQIGNGGDIFSLDCR